MCKFSNVCSMEEAKFQQRQHDLLIYFKISYVYFETIEHWKTYLNLRIDQNHFIFKHNNDGFLSGLTSVGILHARKIPRIDLFYYGLDYVVLFVMALLPVLIQTALMFLWIWKFFMKTSNHHRNCCFMQFSFFSRRGQILSFRGILLCRPTR